MTAAPPTGRSSRTRRDVVDAAIEVWSSDNTASLGAVASAAGVGRTTLNRYFTDRAALLSAVDAECRVRFAQAAERAEPGAGSGLAQLSRLCQELLALGPVLGLVFADNAVVDPDSWGIEEEDDPIVRAVVRGQADGSLAADLPVEWMITHVWTSLFGAWLVVSGGSPLRHEVARLLVRTLEGGLTAR